MANNLTTQQRTELIKLYLQGTPIPQLAKEFEISKVAVTNIAEGSPVTRTEVERKYFAKDLALENEKLDQVKNASLDFITKGLEEANTTENKIYYFSKIKDVLDVIDKMERLNNNQATDRQEHVNKNYNVAEILKELKTPEQKRDFLLNQAESISNERDQTNHS